MILPQISEHIERLVNLLKRDEPPGAPLDEEDEASVISDVTREKKQEIDDDDEIVEI